MKHVQLFEQFINEKVYQLTGTFGAKGIPGKVLFGFKKQVEREKFDLIQQEVGDGPPRTENYPLDDMNETWAKWADKEGAKIIEQEVMKVVKDEDAIVYITATLGGYTWVNDVYNNVNRIGKDSVLITIQGDFVINVGFADDADANKFSRKLGGMQNSALQTGKETSVYGAYDEQVGENNVEIRSGFYLTIDTK